MGPPSFLLTGAVGVGADGTWGRGPLPGRALPRYCSKILQPGSGKASGSALSRSRSSSNPTGRDQGPRNVSRGPRNASIGPRNVSRGARNVSRGRSPFHLPQVGHWALIFPKTTRTWTYHSRGGKWRSRPPVLTPTLSPAAMLGSRGEQVLATLWAYGLVLLSSAHLETEPRLAANRSSEPTGMWVQEISAQAQARPNFPRYRRRRTQPQRKPGFVINSKGGKSDCGLHTPP